MKNRILLLAFALCLGACADGIEPDRPARGAAPAYSAEGHIPRYNDSAARQAGF